MSYNSQAVVAWTRSTGLMDSLFVDASTDGALRSAGLGQSQPLTQRNAFTDYPLTHDQIMAEGVNTRFLFTIPRIGDVLTNLAVEWQRTTDPIPEGGAARWQQGLTPEDFILNHVDEIVLKFGATVIHKLKREAILAAILTERRVTTECEFLDTAPCWLDLPFFLRISPLPLLAVTTQDLKLEVVLTPSPTGDPWTLQNPLRFFARYTFLSEKIRSAFPRDYSMRLNDFPMFETKLPASPSAISTALITVPFSGSVQSLYLFFVEPTKNAMSSATVPESIVGVNLLLNGQPIFQEPMTAGYFARVLPKERKGLISLMRVWNFLEIPFCSDPRWGPEGSIDADSFYRVQVQLQHRCPVDTQVLVIGTVQNSLRIGAGTMQRMFQAND